jgi:hypothetical protein
LLTFHLDLSIVAEDDEEPNDPEEMDHQLVHVERSETPEEDSELSGTTAVTSDSQAFLKDLEKVKPTRLIECIPGLLASSRDILQLLAPPNKISEKRIDFIMKELKKLGSEAGQRLRHREEKFDLDRQYFGTENYNDIKDKYIRVPLIARKIFGSGEIPPAVFRPDAILQAANLATLLRHLFVMQREMVIASGYLSDLDAAFPTSFVSRFDGNSKVGNSNLLEQAFEQALEIRTQLIITDLLHAKNSNKDWSPDQGLADYFFDAPNFRSRSQSYFDDYFENGFIKQIMGVGKSVSETQEESIRARVLQIRQGFRQAADAIEAGDLVDFEYLEQEFPWTTFVAGLARWSRLRADEIDSCIAAQGGLDNIMKALIAAIKANGDPEADSSLSSSPFSGLLPAAEIKPIAKYRPAASGLRYVKIVSFSK